MKKILFLAAGLLVTATTYAQTGLEHFEGTYHLVSAKIGSKWSGSECPGPQIRTKVAIEYSLPAMNLYQIDAAGKETWLDADAYSFRSIGAGETGGSEWAGSLRMTGSYESRLLDDGELMRVQKAAAYRFGIVPTGSSSKVLTLKERNGRLTYRRMIDGDVVVECKYVK